MDQTGLPGTVLGPNRSWGLLVRLTVDLQQTDVRRVKVRPNDCESETCWIMDWSENQMYRVSVV